MNKKSANIVEGKFNLFQEGRNYSGHHRKYVLESVLKVALDPAVREGIRLREKLGYLGHGRRQIARKMNLGEVETAKLPNGQTIIVENVPCAVTVDLNVSDSGDVKHKQEILETAQGKVVDGLIKSRVGGWSWACDGRDGGGMTPTTVSNYYGMDYVYQPGFANNRSYVLENAGTVTRDTILENIVKTGVSDADAEKYLEHWVMSELLRKSELEDQLERSSIYESTLREEVEKNAAALADAKGKLESIQESVEARKNAVKEAAGATTLVIPDYVLESLMRLSSREDFETIVGFFENAKAVDRRSLPLPGNGWESAKVQQTLRKNGKPWNSGPEYGDADFGVTFLKDNPFFGG